MTNCDRLLNVDLKFGCLLGNLMKFDEESAVLIWNRIFEACLDQFRLDGAKITGQSEAFDGDATDNWVCVFDPLLSECREKVTIEYVPIRLNSTRLPACSFSSKIIFRNFGECDLSTLLTLLALTIGLVFSQIASANIRKSAAQME